MRKNKCCFSPKDYNKVCWIIEAFCNFNCSFCFHNQFGRKPQSLAERNAEYSRIIASLEQHNIEHVILSGGEPLLSRDLFNIIELLEAHHFTISISTNAALATYEFCTRLNQTSVKKLTVNLATICDNEGKIVENTNSSSVINGIQNLTSFGFQLTLNNILRQNTSKESILQNIELSSHWGAKIMSFSVPICKCVNQSSSSEYFLSNNIIQKLQSYLEEIEREMNPQVSIEFNYPDCHANNCPANQKVFGINTDGIISTCLVKQYQAVL